MLCQGQPELYISRTIDPFASKTTIVMANDKNCKTVLLDTGWSGTILHNIRDAWAHTWPY